MNKKRTAATKAKNKYNLKSYDRIYLLAKKGEKDIYKQFAKNFNYRSLNEFIIEAIQDKIKNMSIHSF